MKPGTLYRTLRHMESSRYGRTNRKARGSTHPRLAFYCYSPRLKPSKLGQVAVAIMDIRAMAQILSSLATLVVAAGILYQGREARNARDDQYHPQIIGRAV